MFRKWGRVGNDKIGGFKLEEMSKYDAIAEFKRLFLEKTGNPWEAWEQKQNFQKHPGRFFPLDIVCIDFSRFQFESLFFYIFYVLSDLRYWSSSRTMALNMLQKRKIL